MLDPSEILRWLLVLSFLGAGMMAGLFLSFSTFMMKALGSLEPTGGMTAMQAINRFIIRPSFLIVFFGTGLILVVSCFVAGSGHKIFWHLLIASISYVTGCLASTMAFNIPLNNRLDSFRPGEANGLDFWAHYLDRWTTWNHVRSVACVVSALLVGFSLSIF